MGYCEHDTVWAVSLELSRDTLVVSPYDSLGYDDVDQVDDNIVKKAFDRMAPE